MKMKMKMSKVRWVVEKQSIKLKKTFTSCYFFYELQIFDCISFISRSKKAHYFRWSRLSWNKKWKLLTLAPFGFFSCFYFARKKIGVCVCLSNEERKRQKNYEGKSKRHSREVVSGSSLGINPMKVFKNWLPSYIHHNHHNHFNQANIWKRKQFWLWYFFYKAKLSNSRFHHQLGYNQKLVLRFAYFVII